MGLLLRSPFHRFLGKNLTLFTYIGRKSGRRYSFPLGYFRAGQTVAIFAGNPWWRNFREPAPVTLHLDGQPVTGIAQVVTQSGEAKGWLLAYLRALPSYAKYYDVTLDAEGRPDVASVARASQSKVVVRIDLD
jgi:deazaflavin-dependent oxidoreductase (nitroreductase family)